MPGLRPPPDPPRPGWYPSALAPGAYRLWDHDGWHSGVWLPHGEPDAEPIESAPPPSPGHVTVSSTRAERITARANVHLNGVAHMELRARDGDPTFDNSVWVRGHLVYWWKPEIEQLKRDGRLGEALELAWECMEAVEQEFWANASGNYAYGWAWEVALIARKAKRFELEVDVINHVLDIDAFTDLALEHWQKRLATAQRLLAKSSS